MFAALCPRFIAILWLKIGSLVLLASVEVGYAFILKQRKRGRKRLQPSPVSPSSIAGSTTAADTKIAGRLGAGFAPPVVHFMPRYNLTDKKNLNQHAAARLGSSQCGGRKVEKPVCCQGPTSSASSKALPLDFLPRWNLRPLQSLFNSFFFFLFFFWSLLAGQRWFIPDALSTWCTADVRDGGRSRQGNKLRCETPTRNLGWTQERKCRRLKGTRWPLATAVMCEPRSAYRLFLFAFL